MTRIRHVVFHVSRWNKLLVSLAIAAQSPDLDDVRVASIGRKELIVAAEKSLFFYGKPYHSVIDRMLRAARRQVLDRVPQASTVLDVACGTGELALALRAEKNCRVLGIDLSQRMIDFARNRNPYNEVSFELMDATQVLQELDGHSFDFAVVCQLMHEVPADAEVDILRGVTRVAGNTLLLDYRSPLPLLGPGGIPRLIEGSIGRDHHRNFLAYIASGGLPAVVKNAGLTEQVVERSAYAKGTGDLVLLRRPASSASGE